SGNLANRCTSSAFCRKRANSFSYALSQGTRLKIDFPASIVARDQGNGGVSDSNRPACGSCGSNSEMTSFRSASEFHCDVLSHIAADRLYHRRLVQCDLFAKGLSFEKLSYLRGERGELRRQLHVLSYASCIVADDLFLLTSGYREAKPVLDYVCNRP